MKPVVIYPGVDFRSHLTSLVPEIDGLSLGFVGVGRELYKRGLERQ